jgi:hypothetical protein
MSIGGAAFAAPLRHTGDLIYWQGCGCAGCGVSVTRYGRRALSLDGGRLLAPAVGWATSYNRRSDTFAASQKEHETGAAYPSNPNKVTRRDHIDLRCGSSSASTITVARVKTSRSVSGTATANLASRASSSAFTWAI